MISIEQKQQISDSLNAYKKDKGLSLSELNTLTGVHNSSLSQLLKGDIDISLSEPKWFKIGKVVGVSGLESWVNVDTRNMKTVKAICAKAKRHAMFMAISDRWGRGKTAGLKAFAAEAPKATWYIMCDSYYTKWGFIQKLYETMGIEGSMGETIETAMKKIFEHINSYKGNPLLILDEVNELKESAFILQKSLYNGCEGKLGLVAAGGLNFEKRVDKGVKLQKQSYEELYSRYGGQYQKLGPIPASDVKKICMANGIKDPATINQILVTAKEADPDLRIVRQEIMIIRNEQKPQQQ